MINILFVPAILSIVLIMIGLLLKFNVTFNPEVMTPFECGFDPQHNLRKPFSMRFFLISLAFLVFDIEIALILPLPLLIYSYNNYFLTLSIFIFILLLIGAIYEWNNGSLEWK